MKKNFFVFLLLTISNFVIGGSVTRDFEIKEWDAATHEKPLLFYISGDGGFNKFSTSLCEALNKDDFDVIALNAKSYFYDKKLRNKQRLISPTFFQKINGPKKPASCFYWVFFRSGCIALCAESVAPKFSG